MSNKRTDQDPYPGRQQTDGPKPFRADSNSPLPNSANSPPLGPEARVRNNTQPGGNQRHSVINLMTPERSPPRNGQTDFSISNPPAEQRTGRSLSMSSRDRPMGGHRKSASISTNFSKLPPGGLQAASNWKPIAKSERTKDGGRKVNEDDEKSD
ncbi:hypothetical protein TWF788_004873 [Orbilia oligospora]|uniref:Uncharacterized protein n=1 Tax=Orbilia oligospora TaxID=2813651 RepID=A0A7C8PZK6_ORBOL|nr:hypothetical protein TWF788_004873 [Orbilia oligospora]KAF3200359.1 hypothetical protein TWF679_000800 [Orbilia oligospora]